MNRKILMSLGIIVFAVALGLGATGAFFSDSETSTGNTFTAGAIDLQIDSEQHYNGNECIEVTPGVFQWEGQSPWPAPGSPCDGTWALTDLVDGVHKFWNFTDVKPGDEGENTISLHIDGNPAWACIDVDLTTNDDVTCNDPENEAEGAGVCNTDGAPTFDGELAENLKFAAWADDGDNIWETGEPLLFSNQSGPASDVLGGKTYTLADSTTGTPLPGGSTSYIGLAWCAGTQTVDVGLNTITCDGAGMGNDTQTDSMTADVTFRVEQFRNNEDFLCEPEDGGEEGPTVGAALGDYVAPATCDVTVDGSVVGPLDTIQEGVDAATAGQTVCVEDGTYPEVVNVNESVTIAGLGAVGSAIVNGGFIIDADNVTVKGLEVTGGNTEGTFSGFYIKSGVDNLTIRDNDIDGPAVNDNVTAGGSRGVINVSGVPISNIIVENNTIHEWTSGIYTNPDTGAGVAWTIRLNDIDDNLAGIGELNSAVVNRNEFSNSAASQEAIGAGPTYDAVSVVSENNFLSGTMLNTYVSITGDVLAENNFWGPSGGAAQTGGTDEVDFTPEAGAAFAHN